VKIVLLDTNAVDAWYHNRGNVAARIATLPARATVQVSVITLGLNQASAIAFFRRCVAFGTGAL
jgi:hypothetical protein